LAIALPSSASGGAITLAARPADGSPAVPLPPMAPGRIRLDLTSFREYGPHRQTVQCSFKTNSGALAIELVPDEKVDDPNAVVSITLLASAPSRTWGYVASSPFRAGYRYRKAAPPGTPSGSWSRVLSPFLTLILEEDGTMADSTGTDAMAVFDLEGAHFYADRNQPETLYYVPDAPVAELNSQGQPTLMLVQMGESATLQLGAQFCLSMAALSTVLEKITTQEPAFVGARLQPAPINVQKVAVLMTDPSGQAAELKGSKSSSFPPYTAVFSIPLTKQQAHQAISAINGRQGLLFVDYTINLPSEVAATYPDAAETVVRRTDVAAWFAAGVGASHLRLTA
jgi:hypothetical protein